MDKTREQDLTAQSTLIDIIRRAPHAVAAFETLGIDYACRGLTALRKAASDVGVDADDVLAMIDDDQPKLARTALERAPLSTIVSYLKADHTSLFTLRAPRLRAHLESLSKTYPQDALFGGALRTLDVLLARMQAHAKVEEIELFPIVLAIEKAALGEGERPSWRIAQVVLREHVEHQSYCDSLRALCELSETLPPGASAELAAEFSRFSADAHYHMHLENNVLYPRALELENSFRDDVRRAAKAGTFATSHSKHHH